jgi:disabled homolog 2
MIASMSTATTKYHDAFSELDPLKKPYVDKKFFFQDVKNPPKKVLRDLTATGQDSVFDVNFSGGQPPTTADLLSEFVDLNASGGSANTSNSAILSNDLFSTKATNNSSRKDESLTSISSNDFVDPFTNRDIDPFDEEEFCKLPVADPFENLHFPPSKSRISPKTVTVLPDTKITTTNEDADDGSETLEAEKSSGDSVYNGPLQVNLPPESWANYISQKRLERQNSDGQQSGIARNRPSVFKQNTVDVISMKKMKPTNIFGQKFTKRDSNSINMRRLQESDSLSENEAAPEPPPRPDTSSQIAPPPLPPKKQFSDIVIRPSAARPSSGSSVSSRDSNRYDYVAAKLKSQQEKDAPPLPLPSRKVPGGRYESTFPGPGRPQKKPVDEDDYLTPISTLRTGDIPTLLPPPQKKDASKTRAPRKSSETDTRQLNDAERQRLASTQSNEEPAPPPLPPVSTHPLQPVLPDITLSQLLTLGIDDLAAKLNVPTSKLNTMTIVELTSYLSNFIEASKPAPPPPVDRPMLAQMKNESPTPVFRVSFDEGGPNEVTFVAKFDDNFADDPPFVANFDSFNQARTSPQAPAIDRYAAFREILGQDSSNEDTPPLGNDGGEEDPFATQPPIISLGLDKVVADEKSRMSPNVLDESVVKMKRIDTKITETIANAKDRYAALRDIIMVEDLFEKPPLASEESFTEQDDDNECDDDDYDDATATFNTAKDNEEAVIVPASPEINITETHDGEAAGADDSGEQPFNSNNLSSIFSATLNKDDIEIDEYMNRAISNLSLDSRVSPIIASKSPSAVSPVCRQTPQPVAKSPQPVEQQLLAAPGGGQRKPSLNDMSTSPIPIAKSPSLNKSPVMQKSPMSSSKSPVPPTTPSQSSVNLEPSYKNISNSATRSPADDMICGSSPEYESGGKGE